MPKVVDYPRAPLKKAIELATAINDLGGQCTVDLAAERMGMKVSGGFAAITSAGVKHGLVFKKGGRLENTQLYQDYKLAYTDEEANSVLIRSFLSVPLYDAVIDRFNGRPLPVSHLDRLLVREFDVPEKLSSRISKYIVDAARQLGVLGEGNVLSVDGAGRESEFADEDDELKSNQNEQRRSPDEKQKAAGRPAVLSADSGSFTVHVKGPGLDMVVQIDSEFDISLVDMLMQKVKAKLDEKAGEPKEVDDCEEGDGG